LIAAIDAASASGRAERDHPAAPGRLTDPRKTLMGIVIVFIIKASVLLTAQPATTAGAPSVPW
jgi:hypothetical protein